MWTSLKRESDYAFSSRVLEKIGKKGNSWVDLFLIINKVEKMDEFERMVFIALPEKQIKKCLKRWAWEYEKGFKKNNGKTVVQMSPAKSDPWHDDDEEI